MPVHTLLLSVPHGCVTIELAYQQGAEDNDEAIKATRPNRGPLLYAYATDAWGGAFRVRRGRRCRRA